MEPTTVITVTLEAQQWNLVLATLAEGPFRLVAPLIENIQRQCVEPGKGATIETLHPVA